MSGLRHETSASNVVEEEPIDFGEAAPSSSTPTHQQTIEIQTHRLRIVVAVITVSAFLIVNGLVLLGLYQALRFDFAMITARLPNYVRFVSTPVITSLLGATTVQLGAIMFAITKFLFPGR